MWQALAGIARLLPGEAAHVAAVKTLALGLGPAPSLPKMPVHIAGLEFENPLGLAAGFDKNAACYKGAMKLGFGHVEVGTITPLAQPGNPTPRVFRLTEDQAVINRYGFNGKGMQAAHRNLAAVRSYSGILGVNVGANKTSDDPTNDYRVAVSYLAELADYVTLNISSPNTPGLRDLQADENLAQLLAAGQAGLADSGYDRPLFLKMAPDLSFDEIDAIIERCSSAGVSGIIATNTTISRPEGLRSRFAGESGGLSGDPLFELSTMILERVVTRVNKQADNAADRMAVIGVGGVSTGWQAYAKILVGADLVQLYSALALQGPTVPEAIIRELQDLMSCDGVGEIGAAKGAIPDAQKAIKHALLLAQSA